MRDIRVQNETFDVGVELERLEGLGGGAVASFTGVVRGGEGVNTMTLEHYPAMTQAALSALAAEADTRWALSGIILIHRVGELKAGERIVLVATASAHRKDALQACAFLIDRLKTEAPFWKKERGADGAETWVDARESDNDAAGRWG
jgi:molybdopterin synthase catalytic subunit